MDNLFVIGTDTGVGKSVFSLFLVRTLFAMGFEPFYCKPFQTGCRDVFDTDSDAKFVYENTPELQGKDPNESMLSCFLSAKAPYFAARDEGKTIDPDAIEREMKQAATSKQPVVFEAAGGLMVPITKERLLIEVIKAKPVIVGRAGLGTINHTLLTIEALRSRDIEPAGVFFMDSDGETPSAMIQENIEAVESFSGCKVYGVIPKIDDFSNLPETCLASVQNFLKSLN